MAFYYFLIFFSQKYFWGKNICLVCTMLIFSSWKELDSDLNAGRRGVLDQLYGKIKKEARKGPK